MSSGDGEVTKEMSSSVADKRTEEVRRNTLLSSCRVSRYYERRLRRRRRLEGDAVLGSTFELGVELDGPGTRMGSPTAVRPTI
jgi:hypothetical protein